MKKFRYLIAVLVVTIALPIAQGCSSQQTTTTETTQTAPDPNNPAASSTTTTTTTTENEPDSLLGATFHVIGTAILFPFRLVGDALGLIV